MISIVIFFLITSFSLVDAMELAKAPLHNDQHIMCPTEAPRICEDVIKKLYSQPIMVLRKGEACKRLQMNNSLECRIVEKLYNITTDKLARPSQICSLGWRTDEQGPLLIVSGITKYLSDYQPYSENEICIEEALESGNFKKACTEIIEDMLRDWRSSTLAENPSIFREKDENEWTLLIKYQVPTLSYLMKHFCTLMNIATMTECDCLWFNQQDNLEDSDKAYLWIKKQSFDEVVRKLGLHVEQ
jgi:hypothetical protein